MSSPRQQKAFADIVRRLKSVRDLWNAVNNDPDTSEEWLTKASWEFFHKVGEILEGHDLEKMEFQTISRDRVLQQLKEG